MSKQFAIFVIRWLLNTFGLWLAMRLFGPGTGGEVDANILIMLTAGLVFSIANSVLKPIIVILSLPAILLSLGLFMLVVNGIMVYISLSIVSALKMTFLHSILTGIILSLINYIVSGIIELNTRRKETT